MGCLPCIKRAVTIWLSTSYYFTDANVSGKRTLCTYDSSWYECHPLCSTAGKPRTDTCYRNGAAIICTCRADSMEIGNIPIHMETISCWSCMEVCILSWKYLKYKGWLKVAGQLPWQILMSLYVFQQRAYDKYLTRTEDRIPLSFTVWTDKMSETRPQFLFWCRVMELQLLYLQLVKASRTTDFSLYMSILWRRWCLGCMFALDLTNYSRWLPVHLHDMQELPIKHPDVYVKFVDGFFCGPQDAKPILSDGTRPGTWAGECGRKGDGELLDWQEILAHWDVGWLQDQRLPELWLNLKTQQHPLQLHINNVNHHEQSYGYRTSFHKDILSVTDSFEELGNPFEEEEKDLLVVDRRDVMSDGVVETVKNVLTIGQQQYNSYVESRLKQRTRCYYLIILARKLHRTMIQRS